MYYINVNDILIYSTTYLYRKLIKNVLFLFREEKKFEIEA